MKININKAHLIFGFMFIFLVLSFIGPAYSWFSYNKNLALNLGTIDIENTVSGTTTISITNLKSERISEARRESDNYIDFTLTSKNNYQSTNMYYYIKLHYGNDITGKTRIDDGLLVFDLEKTVSGTTTKVIDSDRIPNANGLIIYKDTLAPQTNSKVINFRLRIWVKEGETNLNNKYANFTVEVVPVYFDPTVNAFISFYDEIPNGHEMLINNALPSNQPSEFVTSAINFGNISSNTNGKGLYILPGTENDDYPIAYFRGAVTNNNVIFGGFCWQIVRTTDTGGIKMIYNGVATGSGTTCENTAHADRIISTSAFNTNYKSLSDVGYMYNTRYAYSSGAAASSSIFGKNVEWDGSNYLVIEDTANTASTNETLDANHHYTCGTAGTSTCTSVRYYYYNSGTTYYYITLTGGDTIEDAIYKMTGNGTSDVITSNSGYVLNNTDSTIKTNLETWFRNNLTNEVNTSNPNYVDYLEDTAWCNDRTFKTSGSNIFASSGWNPNGGSLSIDIYFGTKNRFSNSSWYSTSNVPITTCPREIDSFRVNNSIAPLVYPVGLLTADEVIMGGAAGNSSTSNSTYYLYSGGQYWLGAPFNFNNYCAYVYVNSSGYLPASYVNNANGLRAAVSLKLGTEFEDGGDGSPTNPYVVKMN